MSEKKNSSAKSALDENNLENVSGGAVGHVPEHYTVSQTFYHRKKESDSPWHVRSSTIGGDYTSETITGSFSSEENANKADAALKKLRGM